MGVRLDAELCSIAQMMGPKPCAEQRFHLKDVMYLACLGTVYVFNGWVCVCVCALAVSFATK